MIFTLIGLNQQIMKATLTPTDALLKALDLQLKSLLKKDLKAFRAIQMQHSKLAA
jgi:hypothetical protein